MYLRGPKPAEELKNGTVFHDHNQIFADHVEQLKIEHMGRLHIFF